MLIDVKCTLYFEIKDAEIYGGVGTVGYSSISLDHCRKINELFEDEEKQKELINSQIKATAQLLKVEPENVKAITWEEYEAATEDDDDDDDLRFDWGMEDENDEDY